MKRWETALLLALVLTLLAGLAASGGQVDRDTLPQQQVYSWWSVVYPVSSGEQRSEDTQAVLRLKTVELWKQLKQWMKSGA